MKIKSQIFEICKLHFITHKNWNKTSIQPFLKSNSTSFMFYNIFSEMKGKKVIWGNGGTFLISSWKCNFSIYLHIEVYYLDIQGITTLYTFCLFFMCWFLLFINFSIFQPLSWKVTFSGTQKPTPPTVFNLQASDWIHWEEETGVYYQLSQFTYKLVIFNFFIFKVA